MYKYTPKIIAKMRKVSSMSQNMPRIGKGAQQ
jgi:hypothetical protein